MWTVDDLSKELKVSKRKIFYWIEKRQIPFIKLDVRIIRFDPDEIKKHISKNTIKPKQ